MTDVDDLIHPRTGQRAVPIDFLSGASGVVHVSATHPPPFVSVGTWAVAAWRRGRYEQVHELPPNARATPVQVVS